MDDNFITMISKGKGLYPDLNNKAISQSIRRDMALYEDIKHRLIIPDNRDKFIEGVKDIYHIVMSDYYEIYRESVIPSISEVTDFIDEENYNMINLLLEEDSVAVNNIVTIYTGKVTINLESHVEEVLRILGLPFRRYEDDQIIKRSTPLPFHDQFQLRMFGDELYE